MYRIIEKQLKQKEYLDFNQFSDVVLSQDKSNSLLATLELSLRATSIGQSFAIGYRCALQALWPSLKQGQWAALCVSEAQGNHPRQIKTTVNEQGVLAGHKSFVSMAEQAKQLIVIAKIAEHENHPQLKAVLVSQDLAEVLTQPMPNIGMLPDISHGSIELNDAQGTILPGDGYTEFSKRFRYLEDIHVLMGFTSLILSTSLRFKLKPEITEKSLMLISAILNQDLNDTYWHHLHISALFKEFEELVAEFEENIKDVPNGFSENWQRDKKIFSIASKARLARTEKARAALNTVLSF